MPLQEVRDRLDRIRQYSLYHRKAGQYHHVLTQDQLDKLVTSWGHDKALAKGIGRILSESSILAEIKAKSLEINTETGKNFHTKDF